MPESFKDKSVCLIDNGLFCGLAERLARDFGHTYYWSPWVSAFASQKDMRIGRGLPGVDRIDYWEPLIDEVDLWVFPDCYFGPLQLLLQNLGKRVWGSRMAEELELYREDTKRHMEELGIPIGKYVCLTGTDALRSHLKTHNKQVVKRSFTRGDCETFPILPYELMESRLCRLEHELGPERYETKFVVEDAIEDDAVEISYDCYSVDGQFPKRAQWGVEIKSAGYIGKIVPFDKIPKQITENLLRLSPTLQEYQSRSWIALETRVTKSDRVGWVIDPCVRFGNPPGAVCSLICDNLADIMYRGAEGICVDPIPPKDEKTGDEEIWAVQAMIHSRWAEQNWQEVKFPQELRKNVVLVNSTRIGDMDYVIPRPNLSSIIGSVIATGSTRKKAVEKVKEISKKVEGHELEIDLESLNEAEEEMDRLEDFGISI